MSQSPFLRKPDAKARAAAKKSATTVKSRPARAATSEGASLFGKMLEDLARSGLDERDAKAMRLRPHARGELPAVNPPGAGYVIPYFDASGAPRADLYRYRFLEDTRRKGFGALGSEKSRRYTQPSGTPPGVYWPPFASWGRLIGDATVPLVITEGEKKSAISSKMGVPCLGLGGVWSFRSKAMGVKMLPELEDVTWKGRKVYIAYDSDAVRNTQVCAAENSLAEALTKRGAEVYVVRLPDNDDATKLGLDDFLVQFGANMFVSLCEATEPFAMGSALHKLNAEVIYVQDPGLVMVRATHQPLRPSDFVNHRFADRQYTRSVVGANGNTKLEERQAAADWLKWSSRSTARRIVFAPGEDEVTPDGAFNLWKGWTTTPKRGSVALWAELLDFLCDGSPVARKFVEQWAAYPIQNPGTKMHNAVVMWGLAKGTGKSLLGYILGDLYGDAYYEIDDSHIEGSAAFNEWARNRHFVLGDEISGNSARRVANRIKALITREKLEINIKNIPQYSVRDCINYYFTANHPDCFYMEDGDRRLFIHEVLATQPLPKEFYHKVIAWRRSEAGRQALMHHLLYGVNTEDFDPHAPPPVTTAKLDMIEDTRSELEAWLVDIVRHPEAVCQKFGNSDIVSVLELMILYEADNRPRVAPGLVGRKLKTVGATVLRPKDSPSGQIFANGKLLRFVALRNVTRWTQAKSETIRDEYLRTRGLGGAAAKKAKF